MLKRLIQFSVTNKGFCLKCTMSQLAKNMDESINIQEINKENSVVVTNQLKTQKSLLEPLSEDISHISPYLKPTFNFAAYANKSETLQELVKLGVNLHYIEKKTTEAIPFILGLTFSDIREHIIFFNQLGLQNIEIAHLVTKNPFIFKEDLDNLEVRVSYLKFKKFTDDMILRVVSKNPFWLSHSTNEIDQKLGFFQKNLMLSGDEVRLLAERKPKVITYSQHKIKLNLFVIKEEMGFNLHEMKEIVLQTPVVLIKEQNSLLKTFEYLHNVMQVPHEKIVQSSEVLTCRAKRLKERHQFLVKLQRDQFDPTKPNYIGLTTLIKDTDANFASEVAKSSIQAFNLFLKTL